MHVNRVLVCIDSKGFSQHVHMKKLKLHAIILQAIQYYMTLMLKSQSNLMRIVGRGKSIYIDKKLSRSQRMHLSRSILSLRAKIDNNGIIRTILFLLVVVLLLYCKLLNISPLIWESIFPINKAVSPLRVAEKQGTIEQMREKISIAERRVLDQMLDNLCERHKFSCSVTRGSKLYISHS